jgi:hypothetical protein
MRAQPLRNLLIAIALTIVGALLAACSETAPPSGGVGGAGGQGGGDSSALAAELCPGACDTAKTCYVPLDLDACKAQCAEELAGRGYFIQEFAEPFFRKMKELDADANCAVTKGLVPWGPQPPTYDNVPDVAQPEVLAECSAPNRACSEGSFAASCFVLFYVFNEERRDALRSCFKLACYEMNNCMGDNQPAGCPWVAAPECKAGFF